MEDVSSERSRQIFLQEFSIAMSSSNSTSNSPIQLTNRLRCLRRSQSLLNMLQETNLTVNDLIYPVFVMEGENLKEEIPSMPSYYRFSLDRFTSPRNQIIVPEFISSPSTTSQLKNQQKKHPHR